MGTIKHLKSGKTIPVDGCQVAGASTGGAWLASFFCRTGDVVLGDQYLLQLDGETFEVCAHEGYVCERGLVQILALVIERGLRSQ